MAWDFSTEPEFEQQLAWMRAFVREQVWPLETLYPELGWENLRRAAEPLQAEVRSQGLWAAHLDPELGGQGFGQVKLGLMHEILGSSPIAPLIFGNAAPDSGNSEVLALTGTPEQKQRYLYPLLAVKDGEGWVIDGHKWFTSNGSIADFLLVMAVSDPAARPHQRASMFIVDADAPGVEIVRDVATMEHPYESFGKYGNHAEIRYTDVRVGPEALVGAEGAGFLIAQQRLGPGRIHHCMRWLGVARRAFDMLCERSLYRESHGRTLSEHQTIQNWIADSEAEMTAARLMTLHAAWRMDTEGVAAARKDISLIKFYGAKVLHDVIDRSLQAAVGLGYSCDLPLEAMYRFARAARLYDGPDEVHRASVARQVLRGHQAPADGVPSEFIPARRDAARRQFADVLDAVTAND
jgi:acyl-CoA dehydrogenase